MRAGVPMPLVLLREDGSGWMPNTAAHQMEPMRICSETLGCEWSARFLYFSKAFKSGFALTCQGWQET